MWVHDYMNQGGRAGKWHKPIRDCSTAALFERYKIIQIGLGKYAWEIHKVMSCSRISVCKHFERWEPCIHVQHGEVTISIWVRAAFLPTDVKNVHSQTKKNGVHLSLPSLARRMWNFALTLGEKRLRKEKRTLKTGAMDDLGKSPGRHFGVSLPATHLWRTLTKTIQNALKVFEFN